ncbi:hypothetical protein DFH94DRAFT_695009 [Russula ochroleuca]|uniref:Uncharacterized protein n=1 Tax=Russula ochroleuca TaxID=152965 RepID=A0A9P5MRS0_9AGAM|nr:hypothetical protein DFH94DRAFT_695009 [Russula ochroleuca]
MPVVSNTSFSILKTLHEKVENLPRSVPEAKRTSPLAGYCCDPMELTKDISLDVDVWETWDQKLNVLISHSIPDICPFIGRGKYGLIGLVLFLEHLVRDRKVDEGLLNGKVGRIIEAIDSVCKQQDVGDVSKDPPPVQKPPDNVLSEPALKIQIPVGKASKGGRGSWKPPDIISPK